MRFDLDVLDAFRRAIYDGFDYVREIEPAMWTEILRIMNEAAVEGISASRTGYNPHDEDFYRALRHSNEVFSTFKVHNFQQEMAAKLFDGKRLRSFDEWTKATMGIASHQVGSWLETEYNTAVIRAHQAADWQEFVRNKDILPNLRWMPTTSPEPDDKHKHYWMSRLTLPVDDPFWNEHYPGDRWNCKCSLEATDDPVHRPADIPEDKPQRGLDTNAGKTGEMFSQSHPYFPKDCAHCFAKRAVNGIATNSATAPSRPWLAVAVHEASASAFSHLRSFFNASKKKDCFNCPFIDGCMSDSRKNRPYKVTFSKGKGKVLTDLERIEESKASKEEKEKFLKEEEMVNVCAENGHTIHFLYGVNRPKGQTYDVLFDGVPADLKKTGGSGNIVKYGSKAHNEQGAKIVIFEFEKHDKSLYVKMNELLRKHDMCVFFFFSDDHKLRKMKKASRKTRRGGTG